MNTFFKLILLKITIVLWFTVIHETSGQQAQYFSLWNTPLCSGDPFANATASSSHSIPVGTGTIYYKLNGLWAIEMCNSTCNTTRSIQDGIINSGCESISVGIYNTRVQLTRFGDSNQIETRIHFFPEERLKGTPITVNENGANFSTMFVQSYYFTGLNEWGFSPTALSAAVGCCLNYTKPVGQRGYGMTYSFTSYFYVRSVRHGCYDCDMQTPEPIPMPPNVLPITTPIPTTTLRPSSTTEKSSASKLVDYFALIRFVIVLIVVGSSHFQSVPSVVT